MNTESARWFETLHEAWPRLTWLQRTRVFLMCVYFVEKNRFEAWLHGVIA